jgi:hypothetical protein
MYELGKGLTGKAITKLFEAFLTVLIPIHCVEKCTWLYQSRELDDLRRDCLWTDTQINLFIVFSVEIIVLSNHLILPSVYLSKPRILPTTYQSTEKYIPTVSQRCQVSNQKRPEEGET